MNENIQLTILIPIDLSRRAQEIVSRLKYIIHVCTHKNFQISIGHNDQNTKMDILLKKIVHEYNTRLPNLIYINSKTITGDTNLSKLRNMAFENVRTPFVLILDVDIYPDVILFELLLNRMISKIFPFVMIPCLYLLESGTREIIDSFDLKKEKIISEYLAFSRRDVQHLAIPSSVIILKSQDYIELHGFCEEYTGHGYEDFDFMIRLFSKYNLLKPKTDILIDKTYTSPLLAEGFRAYLAKVCLELILEKFFVFHLYHAKNRTEKYYLLREKNSLLFQNRLQNIIQPEKHRRSLTPYLMKSFYKLCKQKKVEPDAFYVLFDARPSYLDRPKTLKKIIQKYKM